MLDIEKPDELIRYLRETGHLDGDEFPRVTRLPGGVSNRTVLVERTRGVSIVIKQALEKLRVEADWFSDPSRSRREGLGLAWLARLAPPGTITPLVFEDPACHLVAMEAVPQPHENWKTRLLAGKVEQRHIERFGELLGTVHRRARETREEVAPVFADASFFESLRLEPYYAYTASRIPEAAKFLTELISITRSTRESLVHGDYSPKNILIFEDRLVLLDHEVIHWGDPAFDLGFSLTHLLSKANHLESQRSAFLNAAGAYWRKYQETAGELGKTSPFEARVANHTLGCLLARVDGRSPLEYLSGEARRRQRAVVLSLMSQKPVSVSQFIEMFGRELPLK